MGWKRNCLSAVWRGAVGGARMARDGYLAVWDKAGEVAGKKGKAAVAAFTLAAVAATGAAAVYGGAYAYVAANETRLGFLNWPATEGTWTGRVVRFSQKGTFPCATYEGRLQIGEASTNYNDFSVRVLQKDIIKQVEAASRSGERVTLTYRDSRLDQSAFSRNLPQPVDGGEEHDPTPILGCIQHNDHVPIRVQATTPMDGQGQKAPAP